MGRTGRTARTDRRLELRLGSVFRRDLIDGLQHVRDEIDAGRQVAGRPLEEDKEKAERSLFEFVRLMWPVLEPGRALVDGWGIRAIIEHLEAVTNGQIKHLLINCPPGFMKSRLLSIFWPAWEWGPRRMPELRILGVSYSEDLAKRDNRLCRNLIESVPYQQLWGDVFQIARDQRAKDRFANDRTGFRIASSLTGLTGERGDHVVIDDPHDVKKMESEVTRLTSRRDFAEVVPSRVQRPGISSIVVCGQRVHVEDVSGLILDHPELGYEHLEIPMHFDPARRKTTSIGWTDPRRVEGELAWPERMPASYIEKVLKPHLMVVGGDYAVRAQLEQQPIPRGGGMFKVALAPIVDEPPAEPLLTVRAWDLAASKKRDSPYTVGVRMSVDRTPTGGFCWHVEHVVRLQGLPHEVDAAMSAAARGDGPGVVQDVPQDPGQAGKAQIRAIASNLRGFQMVSSPESGDKEVRASGFASQWNAGNVRLVRGPWNDAFKAELELFPMGHWKDQVDACSRAFARLLPATEASNEPAGAEIVTR